MLRAVAAAGLSVAVLAGCQSGDAGSTAGGSNAGQGDSAGAAYEYVPIAGPTATPAERAACEAVGGEIRPAGLAGYEHCVQTFADAGASCRDAGDCMGQCLLFDFDQQPDEDRPVTGRCQTHDALYGCYAWIEDGAVAGSICVD